MDRTRSTREDRSLYRTERWKQLSLRRLQLHPWCVGWPIGKHGTEKVLAEVTDHIKPASLYPELFFEETNHQSLCRDCNTLKGYSETGGAC